MNYSEYDDEDDYSEHIEQHIAALTAELLPVLNGVPAHVQLSAKIYALVEAAFALVDPSNQGQWALIQDSIDECQAQHDLRTGRLIVPK